VSVASHMEAAVRSTVRPLADLVRVSEVMSQIPFRDKLPADLGGDSTERMSTALSPCRNPSKERRRCACCLLLEQMFGIHLHALNNTVAITGCHHGRLPVLRRAVAVSCFLLLSCALACCSKSCDFEHQSERVCGGRARSASGPRLNSYNTGVPPKGSTRHPRL
jgi:hypothetical protein